MIIFVHKLVQTNKFAASFATYYLTRRTTYFRTWAKYLTDVVSIWHKILAICRITEFRYFLIFCAIYIYPNYINSPNFGHFSLIESCYQI
jgi:hypothetical protein